MLPILSTLLMIVATICHNLAPMLHGEQRFYARDLNAQTVMLSRYAQGIESHIIAHTDTSDYVGPVADVMAGLALEDAPAPFVQIRRHLAKAAALEYMAASAVASAPAGFESANRAAAIRDLQSAMMETRHADNELCALVAQHGGEC